MIQFNVSNLPTDSELSSLSSLGQDLYEAEENVFQAEHELKIAKKKRDHIAHGLVPELMKELGVESISMTGGRKVDVKSILSVVPLAADRPMVLKHLEEQGAGSLIKTTVTVPFARGEDDKVKALLDLLQGRGLAGKLDKKVEPPTLKKHIKDRLAKGLPVPKEFNVKEFFQAAFSEGKPKKPIFDDE